MNLIKMKAEVAMRVSSFNYLIYQAWLNKVDFFSKSNAIKSRTIAVVTHDRVLNGREI